MLKPGMPQRRRLRAALRTGFDLIQQDTDGPVSDVATVQIVYAEIEAAWRECPDPDEVYAQECAAWQRERGRDPLTGRPLMAAGA